MDTDRDELFSERLIANERTYFFDVKVSPNGFTYLSISETRKNGDKRERSRLIIDKTQLREFNKALSKVSHVVYDQAK